MFADQEGLPLARLRGMRARSRQFIPLVWNSPLAAGNIQYFFAGGIVVIFPCVASESTGGRGRPWSDFSPSFRGNGMYGKGNPCLFGGGRVAGATRGDQPSGSSPDRVGEDDRALFISDREGAYLRVRRIALPSLLGRGGAILRFSFRRPGFRGENVQPRSSGRRCLRKESPPLRGCFCWRRRRGWRRG